MPSNVTSVNSPIFSDSFAWLPVLFISNGETPCGISLGFNRRLAPQRSEQDAYAVAKRACGSNEDAIGFTVERVHACILPRVEASAAPSQAKSDSSIQWLIKTVSGAVLAKCRSHAAATRRIEVCQARPSAFPAWLGELRIQRVEVGA